MASRRVIERLLGADEDWRALARRMDQARARRRAAIYAAYAAGVGSTEQGELLGVSKGSVNEIIRQEEARRMREGA